MNPGVLLLVFTAFVSSEELAVTKRDGETVTLHLNRTGHRFEDYLWTYGRPDPVLAITIVTEGKLTPINGTRFKNRLRTHIETASITISNLTVNDSGIFQAQILTEEEPLLSRFNLTVHENRIIYVNVLEGNSVTLDPGIKKLQKDHTVMWTQGPDFGGTLIAQWKDSKTFIIETLKDVLQLNQTTGALTLNNMTSSLAGCYCVTMLEGTDPYILRQYSVTVYELVPKPHITSAPANTTVQSVNDVICYVQCSVRNAPEVTLSWYQGEKRLNEISDPDVSNLTLPEQIQSQPEVVYTCRAANPVSEATATLNSTEWCPPHPTDSKDWIWITVLVGAAVVLVGVAGVVGLIIYLLKLRNNGGAQRCCEIVTFHQDRPPLDNSVAEGSNELLLPHKDQRQGPGPQRPDPTVNQ